MEKANILIVDPDDCSRLLLEEILRSSISNSYQILSTSCGNEAFELLKKWNIRLVLMEINMKEMDGWEVARSIKELYPEIPVIIQTATVTDDIGSKVNTTGADSYLTKPLDSSVISNKVKEVLELSPSN